MQLRRGPVFLVVVTSLLKALLAVRLSATTCDQWFVGSYGYAILTSANFPLNYTRSGHACTYRIYSTPLTLDGLDSNKLSDIKEACFNFKRFSLGDGSLDCSSSNAYLEFPGGIRYCNRGAVSTLANGLPPQSVFEPSFCWDLISPSLDIKFSYSKHGTYTDRGFYATFTVQNRTRRTDIGTTVWGISKTKAPCAADNYMCFDNQACIPRERRCDNFNDCDDGSDEDYSHARCPGRQDFSGCDFEGPIGAPHRLCHFKGINWYHEMQSTFGPRYDHTIGILRGPGHFMYTSFNSMTNVSLYSMKPVTAPKVPSARCFRFWYFMSGADIGQLAVLFRTEDVLGNATNSAVWSRIGHQGSKWFPAEIDIPQHIGNISQLSFVATKGTTPDVNIAIDDLSLTEGACYGSDMSCTFELSLCGWYLDQPELFSAWNRTTGISAAPGSKRPSTDCSLDGHGWYMYTDFEGRPGTKAVRMISRPITHVPEKQTWCLTYCYYKAGQGAALNTTQLRVKLRLFDGTERLENTVERVTQGYWDEQKLLVDIHPPFQVIFEAHTTGTVDIGIDSITLVPDMYCSSSGTTKPPSITTTPSRPTVCDDYEFRCDDGKCIWHERVCDGRFDCEDFSDENSCGYTGMSIAAIAGIVSGLLLAIIVCLLSFLWVRKNTRRSHRQQRPDSLTEGDFTDTTTYGEPPPLYSEVETTPEQSSSQRHTMSIMLSWEPPPAYEINPVSHSGPDAPTYTPRRGDPPPFEERNSIELVGKARGSQAQHGGDGVVLNINDDHHDHQSGANQGEGRPSRSQNGTNISISVGPTPDTTATSNTGQQPPGVVIRTQPGVRNTHVSVAIVGTSATGENLLEGFSTHQPVVYQVPNRYRRSFRRSFMRRSRRSRRSQSNTRRPANNHSGNFNRDRINSTSHMFPEPRSSTVV